MSTCVSSLSILCTAFVLLSFFFSPSTALLTEGAATSDLAAGLFVNQAIIEKILPQNVQSAGSSQTPKEKKQFYELLHSLTLIGDREKELQAILTMSGLQDDTELMAIQVILQKLTNNACALLKLKVGDQMNCTYADLKVLKSTIEALRTVKDEAIPTLFDYYPVIENIFKPAWIRNNVVCNLSTSSLELLNSLNLYRGQTYSQDSC